jgi:hypothetical protein
MAQAALAEAQTGAFALFDDDEVSVPFLREVELAAGSGRFVIDRGVVVPQAYVLEFRMHVNTPAAGRRCDVRAPAQLISAYAEVFGDFRNVFIRRIDDLPAENPRES